VNLRRARPWIESVALHLVLLALLFVAVPWSSLTVGSRHPRKAPEVRARVVSNRAIERAWRAYRARQDAAARARAAKLAALAAAARKAAAEKKAEEAKLAALREAAAQARAARARALAAQKEAELVRARELAAARAAAAQRAREEALARAAAARARAARLAALAAARARAEAEARAQARALAAAAARRAAARGRVLNAWVAAIRRRVENAWIRPSHSHRSLRCTVYVTLAPGGAVLSAHLGSCNGDPAERESILAAVYRASPLPMPSDPADFVSHLRFLFEPGV
jgi:colicin import membrane protein